MLPKKVGKAKSKKEPKPTLPKKVRKAKSKKKPVKKKSRPPEKGLLSAFSTK